MPNPEGTAAKTTESVYAVHVHGGEVVVRTEAMAPPNVGNSDQKNEVQRAEETVRRRVQGAGSVFGYRAGVADDGRRLMVVATERVPEGDVIVRTKAEVVPAGKRARGMVWCTLVMLAGMSGAAAKGARLCGLSVASWLGHHEETTGYLQQEHLLRNLLGYRPGRTDLLAPVRALLDQGQAVTPRHLIPAATLG